MAKTIQVRNVPDTVHRELNRQAEAAGMSLNTFMLREMERTARRAQNAEILRRAAERPGTRLRTARVVAAIHDDRRRDE